MPSPINNFLEVAKRTEYDNQSLGPYVAWDLEILMKDGSWFDRDTIDNGWGEYWQFHKPPVIPANICRVERLAMKEGGTLANLNMEVGNGTR
ncbi:MAG: hypothetical protein J5654_04925 [Victivallales bacterium]|nr:hypothetical protein [Victivallales bacterium]